MEDANIVIVPNSRFLTVLEEYKDHDSLPNKFKNIFHGKREDSAVKLSVNDLKELQASLRDFSNELSIHELLENVEIKLPTPDNPPRDPELEMRVQQLKIEQENRDYINMTWNVDAKRRYQDSGMQDFREDLKMIRQQMIAIVNFILTVGGSFVFGYKMVEYSLPNPSIPAQVLVGVLLSTIVAIADLYFLLRVHLAD